jgi:serine/threonine protein kinase
LIDLYQLLHQVTSGMKYLETMGMIHRCLTARTVYLVAPRHAKIGSFAMSKYLAAEEDYFAVSTPMVSSRPRSENKVS